MSAWNPRRVSEAAAILLLTALAVSASGAQRVRPAPGVDAALWERYADEDRVWSASWPADWIVDEAPETLAPDSLQARLRRMLAGDADPDRGARSDRLRTRWQRRGHLGCRITVVEGSEPYVLVDPGPAYRVGRVDVEGLEAFGDPRRLRDLLPATGDAADARTWERGVGALLRAAGNAGRPFAAWSVRSVRLHPARATVDLAAVVTAGEPATVGRIASSLPPGAGHRFLVRASGLREGGAFRQDRLEDARGRLLQRGLWLHVEEPVVFVTTAPDTVGVYWPVVSSPRPNRFAVVLGLSRRDDGDETRLSGQVDLHLGNIAGTGRVLDLAWSDDGDDRSHLGFGWLEPLAFGTPLDVQLAVDQENVEDVHDRIRVDADVILPVAGAWGVSLGVGRDRVSYPSGTWTGSSRWRSRGALLHRRGDRARSGWSGRFAVESASRSAELRGEEDDDGAGNLQESRQTLVDLEIDGELWLARAVSVGLRGRFADVADGDGPVPLAEQSRLGGARSLRGYREDAFHGERTALASVELRLGRAGRSRVYSFLDLGYVRLTSDDPDGDGVVRRTERPRGYGLGLETSTPGGDVSLAIGFPGTVDFDLAKLHVSLIQAF